jgi:hypothetical protein
MLGAAGSGACASGDGASASSVTCTFGSGAGTVVVTTGSVPGFANAGAIPPVSAVREITTPDARTATMLRLEQISSGAPMCVDSSYLVPRCIACGNVRCGNVAVAPSSTQRINRWFDRTVTAGTQTRVNEK